MAVLNHKAEGRTPLDLKSVVVFDVPEFDYPHAPTEQRRPFRDPAGLPILRRIADGLSKRGYRTTEVKRAHGIEAGFGCRLRDESEISIILGVSKRRNGSISCGLITYYSPSLLDRWRASSDSTERVAEWSRLCDAINEEIVSTLRAPSVLWLTEAEASELWKRGE